MLTPSSLPATFRRSSSTEGAYRDQRVSIRASRYSTSDVILATRYSTSDVANERRGGRGDAFALAHETEAVSGGRRD